MTEVQLSNILGWLYIFNKIANIYLFIRPADGHWFLFVGGW